MNVTFEIDPLGKFPASDNSIIEATGILPHWLDQGIGLGESAKDALLNRYDFYIGPMSGGEILENGVFRYPGDPDIYPLMKADLMDDVVYFYQYAIVGIVNKKTGEQFITRMD